MYEDDFAFLKKKTKIGWVEDDFTCNVVLHSDNLILFGKKISTDPILQIYH